MSKRIARVFPTKTNMSPADPNAYFGLPPRIFNLDYDEIHISVTFTWDIADAKWLASQWEYIAPVKIGGPAIDGEPLGPMVPGMYLREGVTITSRGCPNRCPFCQVRSPLVELDDFPVGNIVQDNNLLACSGRHLDRVFQMLGSQSGIQFQGGLDVYRISPKIVERLRGLRIKQIFIAYDREAQRDAVIRAVELLGRYFNRNKIRCFVLTGFNGETLDQAQTRLVDAWDIGTLPFAMLYRNERGEYPQPEGPWRSLQRTWARPAATRAIMKEGKPVKGEEE